ncbi:unnamed protein product, partial [marine sediment metagenome]
MMNELSDIPSISEMDIELDRRKYLQSFWEFFCDAWKVIEPDTQLVKNWHLQYLCNELEQLLYRC